MNAVPDSTAHESHNLSKESLPSNVSASDEAEIVQYQGNEQATTHDLSKSETILLRVQTKLSFFNERLKENRKSIMFQTMKIYLIMGVFVLAVFSIYWGSYYERNKRLKNLRMLVVIEDDQTINGIEPFIGNSLREVLQTPQAQQIGKWLIQDSSEFNEMAAKNNLSVFDEVKRQVHDQHYWSSIYVKPNATYNLYQAISNGDTSYNVSYNSIVSYYETGRDIIAMGTYVTPMVQKIGQMFLRQQSAIIDGMFNGTNTSQIFDTIDSVKVAGSSLEFFNIDGIPFTDPVIVAPAQVGLIYMVILTFFSFNFFSTVYPQVGALNLKPHHMLLYRVGSTVFSFFVLSFFFSMVSLAFQVDFTRAFGKGGWPVYWATNFLTMWAVGAINEAAAMVIIIFYPPMVGFWLLFWVVANISATFSPIALCPEFYRYCYGMPIHASYEITKVIIFDTYRGALGRNYGILVAWVVLATVLLTVLSINFGKVMGRRAKQEKMRQEQQFLEKYQNSQENDIILEP